MKNKFSRITAIILILVMVFALVPSMALAEELRTVTNITVVGKKPCPNTKYANFYNDKLFPEGVTRPEYRYDIKSGEGLKVNNDKWYVICESGVDLVTSFTDCYPYLLIMSFNLEDGYKLPENLKDIDVTIKYDNGETIHLPKESYRPESEFDDGVDTYCLCVSTVDEYDLVLCYVMDPHPRELPEVIIRTAKPEAGDKIKNNDKYYISINNYDSALKLSDCNWLELRSNGELVHADRIIKGKTYVLSLDFYFDSNYKFINKVPNPQDIDFCIEFLNENLFNLQWDNYREPEAFKYENTTYTVKYLERTDRSCKINFLYAVTLESPELTDKSQNNVISNTQLDETKTDLEESDLYKVSESEKSNNIKEEKTFNALRIGIITGTVILAVALVCGGAAYVIVKKKKI